MKPSLQLLLALALACPDPKLENRTKFPWNDFDIKNLGIAQKRCGQLYDDAPCLKLFIKWGEQDYHAICGAEDK